MKAAFLSDLNDLPNLQHYSVLLTGEWKPEARPALPGEVPGDVSGSPSLPFPSRLDHHKVLLSVSKREPEAGLAPGAKVPGNLLAGPAPPLPCLHHHGEVFLLEGESEAGPTTAAGIPGDVTDLLAAVIVSCFNKDDLLVLSQRKPEAGPTSSRAVSRNAGSWPASSLLSSSLHYHGQVIILPLRKRKAEAGSAFS